MPMFSPSIFRHEQETPAVTWTITHNLGMNGSQGIPIVDVYLDNGGDLTKIIPSNCEIIDENTVQLTFGIARAGFAVVIV